jgi:hypothetical protein
MRPSVPAPTNASRRLSYQPSALVATLQYRAFQSNHISARHPTRSLVRSLFRNARLRATAEEAFSLTLLLILLGFLDFRVGERLFSPVCFGGNCYARNRLKRAGTGNVTKARLVRHSQRKRGATDRPTLMSTRQSSSLPGRLP